MLAIITNIKHKGIIIHQFDQKNSTASWIIEVKKEALLREQKRKLKQEREKMEQEGKIQHANKDKNITQPVIDNIGRNNIKKKALKVTINPEDKSTVDEMKTSEKNDVFTIPKMDELLEDSPAKRLADVRK